MSADAPEPTPHARDLDAIEGMRDVVRVYVNDSRWWQNASFALPLIVSVVSLAVGLVFQRAEGIGFGLFASAVTVIMIPVVLLTWRSTATSIVLTRTGASALHAGKVLHHVDWSELQRIERVEYLGNTRYKLVHHDTEFLTVESEIAGSADLVETAFALSGVPRQSEGPVQG
ncbi:MAG: hypothetical protein AB7G21_10645 [Dehalococcoidia bacterium]